MPVSAYDTLNPLPPTKAPPPLLPDAPAPPSEFEARRSPFKVVGRPLVALIARKYLERVAVGR